MTAKFTRWITFVTLWITHDIAKGDTITGHFSPHATHHRIIIVVPTEIRHVNHIHHYPLKGHKSIYTPRIIYYRIPIGAARPYAPCAGEPRHPSRGKPVHSPGYNSVPTTSAPKVNGYNDNKNVDYSQDRPEGEGPPPSSQEDKGYYDDTYADPPPGPDPSHGPADPPVYDSPKYNDGGPTDLPPPPPYRKKLSRYSYNGHGGAGSGSFPTTGIGHTVRAEKFFHDFNKFGIPPSRDKFPPPPPPPPASFEDDFKTDTSGVDFDDFKDFDHTTKKPQRHKFAVTKDGKLPSDFPYKFNHEKFPPRYPVRNSFRPPLSVDFPQETSYPFSEGDNGISSLNFEGKNAGSSDTYHSPNVEEEEKRKPTVYEVPTNVYSSPAYEDKIEDDTGTKEDNYDYINTDVGPNEFNDNYQYVHQSEELKAQLGLTSEESDNFPSAEYPSDSPKPDDLDATLPPENQGIDNSPSFHPSQPDPTPQLPGADFQFYKTSVPPRKKVKYVSYVNGPFSTPPTQGNDNEVKIEKQSLIPLKPVIISREEFFKSPVKSYDKVIGHGRAMYSSNTDYKFDTQVNQKYEIPIEPHKLQSKMHANEMLPDSSDRNTSDVQLDLINLKDRIHQIHGYVPKE